MSGSGQRRLFVALWPDDPVRPALAAARDRWTWSATARPTPTGNLHATLLFLGDVASSRVADVTAGLAVPFEPFVLRLGVCAAWHNGIAALEPFRPATAVCALQAGIAERSAALGFAPEERRYRPHVTLARDARGSTPPPDAEIAWPVSSYALIESRGGRYTTVATWRAD